MPRELEPWGGDLRTPRLIRRLIHRPDPLADTPERAHERRNPEATLDTPVMGVHRAILGGFAEAHPGNRAKHR